MLPLSPGATGIVGLVALLVLILLRFPLALALGLVAILGLLQLIGLNSTLSILGAIPYDFAASWELSAAPMFLVMGAVAFHSGMTADLYAVARIWLRRLPGGLAIASNFACAGFAAASGSSVATTVAMGRIALPEMLKVGYDKALATGTVASAGTLGALIPPSVLLILFGVFAGQSVSALFLAGIGPGLLTAAIYAAMIGVRCIANRELAPMIEDTSTLREKLVALLRIWPLPVLIIGVIGSIYGGVATPTEAGAVGAILAAVIAAGRGQMSWAVLRISIIEALQATATIFFISINALLMTRFLIFSGLPYLLTDFVEVLSINLLSLLLVVVVIHLILGTFIDPIGLVLITLPVVLPPLQALDVNLIWYGVLVVKLVEIGCLTPPLGMNVFAMKAVARDVPLETIFRGVLWFIVADLVVVGLMIAFPQIALAIPRLTWVPQLF